MYALAMVDKSAVLALVLFIVLAVCGWLWFQVSYNCQDEAETWLKVHQAEVGNPQWYKRPPFEDYRKPPPFTRFEISGETVPRFWASMVDRRAVFRVRLDRKDGRGEDLWRLEMEDRGSLLLSDWKPVLFLPERRVRRP